MKERRWKEKVALKAMYGGRNAQLGISCIGRRGIAGVYSSRLESHETNFA